MRKSSAREITPLSGRAVLHLSWTHILELIRIDDPLKRAFYENECLKGNWSKRQLQRQIGSLLYERTGLSKNRKAVVARARIESAMLRGLAPPHGRPKRRQRSPPSTRPSAPEK